MEKEPHKQDRMSEPGIVDIDQLKTTEERLVAELRIIEEPFDEETKRNLWRYAAGQINAQEAQAAGDGASSIAEQQSAGRAYRELSSKGIVEAGDRYHELMSQLKTVRNRIYELN